jgi:hypothetical protein
LLCPTGSDKLCFHFHLNLGISYCVYMYINGKVRHVETILGMGQRGKRRMMEGVNSVMIYLIYCKNFCKCHNVPHQNNKKIISQWPTDLSKVWCSIFMGLNDFCSFPWHLFLILSHCGLLGFKGLFCLLYLRFAL